MNGRRVVLDFCPLCRGAAGRTSLLVQIISNTASSILIHETRDVFHRVKTPLSPHNLKTSPLFVFFLFFFYNVLVNQTLLIICSHLRSVP